MTDLETSNPSQGCDDPLPSPIVLSEASGNWVGAHRAAMMVEEAYSLSKEEARKALCRRAVVVIPVDCASWSIKVGPYCTPERIDFSPPVGRLDEHFKRTMNSQSFEEILRFFKALEHGEDREGHWSIGQMVWETGDFTVHMERDFRTITLSVVGLKFDRSAIERSFSEAPSGCTKETQQTARPGGGRPRSSAWTDWIAELASYIHENGIPEGHGAEGQEELIAAIDTRLTEKGLPTLSRTTVQATARAVLLRLRSAENGDSG